MKRLILTTAVLAASLLTACAYHEYPVRPALVNHPVFITLNDPADVDECTADCDRLLATIPGVVSYYCGTPLDTGRDTVDTNYHVGLYLGFNSVEDYNAYVTHPQHVATVEKWKPRIKVLMIRDVIDETP
ncbi:MAG: Dabb family protein [Phycisphaerales bacterium]|nr:Dabb family protein [Phycisphaerales bacterium]